MLETSPKGCLKFNVCGEKSEGITGLGGVLRDEEGLARALFSGPSDADNAEFVEAAAIIAALDVFDRMGWAASYPILVDVGSSLVLKWLLKEELRPRKTQMLFRP